MSQAPFPCLWFDGKSREAADFYCAVFPDSRVISDNGFLVVFELRGRPFTAMNGGPQFTFNESVSFMIECEDQAEIDHYWDALTEGGEESRCGWLKDRFGLSWQVIPRQLGQWMSDPETAGKAVAAFREMRKMDIETIRKAVES